MPAALLALRRGWLAALDLALPLACAACGRPGAPCCAVCAGELTWAGRAGGSPRGTARVTGPGAGPGVGPRRVIPSPAPPGLPPTWAAGPYQSPLRDLVVAYKDGDRRDVRAALGAALAPVVLAAARGSAEVVVVPMPTSPAARRRRGDDPLADLLAVATGRLRRAGLDVRIVPALRVVRRVADQSRLDAAARGANLAGAFEATRDLRGLSCVLADDVLTTGATLAEAARAVRRAGGRPAACAVLAATPRRGVSRAVPVEPAPRSATSRPVWSWRDAGPRGAAHRGRGSRTATTSFTVGS